MNDLLMVFKLNDELRDRIVILESNATGLEFWFQMQASAADVIICCERETANCTTVIKPGQFFFAITA